MHRSTVATIPDEISFALKTTPTSFIAWSSNPAPPPSYLAALNNNTLWASFLPSIDSPIATIPEPSSAVLASIGAVVALLAYGWSRHRREQRRQASA
jgi:hypothetical protein